MKASELLYTVLGLLLLACGCRDAKLVSSSMTPTIQPGEIVSLDYSAYALSAPGRWDVVGFEPPMFTNQIWLMRVVGLPGETVLINRGTLTIDGKPTILPTHMTNVTYTTTIGTFGVASAFIIPKGAYFVLGDNSINSNDSRFWGALPRASIVGKVRNK